ncbi:MAG: DUF935 family protein [Bacteroidota bacterium]
MNRSIFSGMGPTRTDGIEFDKLYAYYDRGKKRVADYLREYQYVSNYKYYKHLSSRVDHRFRLMDIYDYTMQDLHLTSIINTLFHHILGERYFIANADRSRDDAATKLIRTRWFTKLVKEILFSKLYAYSMIELGGVNPNTGTLEKIESIERRNVAPGDHLILEYPEDNAGWDVTTDRFRTDYVLIDGDEQFGWLLKAAPMVMSKRFAISAHTQTAETYGVPLVHGKTVMDETEDKQRLANEIASSRDQRIIITGIDDEIDIKDQISNDTNKIYTELVRVCNDELTKLILSQTATTEQQTYVGAAQIQYQIYKNHVEAMREFVVHVVNEQFMWRFREKGMAIRGDQEFVYSNNNELSPGEVKEILDVLTKSYEIDPEEIEKQTGIKVGRQILKESNGGLLETGGAGDDQVNFLRNQSTIAASLNKSTTGIFDTIIASVGLDTAKHPLLTSVSKIYEPARGHTHLADRVKLINAIAPKKHEEYYEILAPLLPQILEGEEIVTDADLVLKSAEQFLEAVRSGYGVDLGTIDLGHPENKYFRGVWDHVWAFAAVKQFQLLHSIHQSKDSFKGRLDLFQAESRKLNSIYNKLFFTAESNHIEHSMRVSAIWRGIDDPNTILQYQTVGDDRVRANHQQLDGIRRRKNDSFWGYFLPPWEYGCRCTVFDTGTTDGRTINKDRKLPDISEVPEVFRGNVGETGVIFGEHHPYFNVPSKFVDDIRKSVTEGQQLFTR